MRLTIPSPLLRTNDALRQAGVERPVFVGGAIVELLLTDPASPEPRPTEDVDVTIDVVGRVHFYALEDQLRLQGHKQVTDKGAPMCRWTVHGILVDLMPTDASILGFGNRWYARAVEFAECVTTGESTIHIASAPLFTAM